MSEEEFNEEHDLKEGEGEDEWEDYDYEANLDYKIENVVGTVVVEIEEKIDLNQIARKLPDVE